MQVKVNDKCLAIKMKLFLCVIAKAIWR